jgi:hypothetical protein
MGEREQRSVIRFLWIQGLAEKANSRAHLKKTRCLFQLSNIGFAASRKAMLLVKRLSDPAEQ